ncbi:MAG: hypothetical protein ACFFEE_02300 [Candidatus Thorarchaeota archaeon]
MRKGYLKILVAIVAIFLICAVSVGDIPEAMEVTNTHEKISKAMPSAIVWEDNFDDEDISDWQIFKVNHTASPDTLMPGNTTAVGGVMRHLETEWSYAGHNSSVAFGTWTFDVDIQKPVNEYHFSIAFISEVFDDDWLTYETVGEAYGVTIYLHEGEITEIRLTKGNHETGASYLGTYTKSNLVGWNNIIVTRDQTGHFWVYLNGNFKIYAKDLQYSTSERFYFLSHGGPAIDNLTVSDTIDYDAAPPQWDPPIVNQIIDAGTDFHYDLNVSDSSGIDQWWINDTVNFDIDDDGVISNIDILEAGSYVIGVSVNDTLGNTQTGAFRLTVRELPTAFPMELVVGGVGVAVFVIIVLVVWRKKS